MIDERVLDEVIRAMFAPRGMFHGKTEAQAMRFVMKFNAFAVIRQRYRQRMKERTHEIWLELIERRKLARGAQSYDWLAR